MNCEEINDLLSAYMDNELPEEERRHVATHLDACSSCQAQLNTLKNTVSALRGLKELEVPDVVAHSLRQIAGKEPVKAAPVKKRLTMPALKYLVATGVVAAIALVSVLTVVGKDGLVDKFATDKAAIKYGQESLQSAPAEKQESFSEANDSAIRGIPAEKSGAAKSLGITDEAAKNGGEMNDAGGGPELKRSPAQTGESWPVVLASKKNYDAASAEALLDDIHKKTGAIYTVEDSESKREQVVNTLVERITARGGEGELMRSPVNKLLDRTKRAALPVYMEKARFEDQDCWLIAIKWGFGDEKSDLYRTSLYITDLSGWNIIHYSSK